MVRKVKAAPRANTVEFNLNAQIFFCLVRCSWFAIAPTMRKKNAAAKNTLQQNRKLKTTISVHALHQHQWWDAWLEDDLRATPQVLIIWTCKKSRKSNTYSGLAQGPEFLHCLLRLVNGTAKPNTGQRRL